LVYSAVLVAFTAGTILLCISCRDKEATSVSSEVVTPDDGAAGVQLIVLGTIQDAGSPQLGCDKECCLPLYLKPDPGRQVVSLGVIDQKDRKSFLFEATPDITAQLNALRGFTSYKGPAMPSGIFLTHAHVGHYTGLMYLGREAADARELPVYAMPRMRVFLEENKPWEQLVSSRNIVLQGLENQSEIMLTPRFRVRPVLVPHRDEYSETVGYVLMGPEKKALFIPDIDKWEHWDRNIVTELAKVDYAFIDATFYDANELPGRDMSLIPHPFVQESMALFREIPASEKAKIYFIHFNHTNPLLNPESEESQQLLSEGFKIAGVHDVFNL
jgi:pyrroloquinoline quinone biosynthesis protein B